jgi:hypothetical protein
VTGCWADKGARGVGVFLGVIALEKLFNGDRGVCRFSTVTRSFFGVTDFAALRLVSCSAGLSRTTPRLLIRLSTLPRRRFLGAAPRFPQQEQSHRSDYCRSYGGGNKYRELF